MQIISQLCYLLPCGFITILYYSSGLPTQIKELNYVCVCVCVCVSCVGMCACVSKCMYVCMYE